VTVTLMVNASSAGCTITTTSLGVLNVGTFASVPLTYTGVGCPSAGNFEWNESPGMLPSGLGILPDVNAISGTPTGAGSYSFTLEMISSVPGAVNPVATQAFSGTIGAETACAIGPLTLPGGTVGQNYTQDIAASAACTTPNDDPTGWAWTLGGNVPPGLRLSPLGSTTTPNFFGTPTTAGTYTFTIEFQESVEGENGTHNASVTQSFTMMIASSTGGTGVAVAPARAKSK
jgi:hypothetical protein